MFDNNTKGKSICQFMTTTGSVNPLYSSPSLLSYARLIAPREQCHLNFDKDCIKSIEGLGQYGHFKNINSCNP